METRWYAPRENAQTENLFAEQSPTLLRNIHNRVFPRGDQITLQGKLGAGKSNVAKIIAKELSLDILSGGTFRRAEATKRVLTLLQLNEIWKTDPSIDIATDMQQFAASQWEEGFIIDGRVGTMTAPSSLKVFMDVSDAEWGRRIYEDSKKWERWGESPYGSKEEAMQVTQERMKLERARYLSSYGFDVMDLRLYDVVIDTTGRTIQEVADILTGVIERINSWEKTHLWNFTDKPLHF
jgi:cytidylate kinase